MRSLDSGVCVAGRGRVKQLLDLFVLLWRDMKLLRVRVVSVSILSAMTLMITLYQSRRALHAEGCWSLSVCLSGHSMIPVTVCAVCHAVGRLSRSSCINSDPCCCDVALPPALITCAALSVMQRRYMKGGVVDPQLGVMKWRILLNSKSAKW